MASKPRRPSKNRPLRAVSPALAPGHVPKKWVKFVVGVFLLFPCWVLTLAFFDTLIDSAGHSLFWTSPEFLWFAGGSLLGVLGYFIAKPLVWLYVIGHELTHALLVWLHGGRVHDFHVARAGGHIVTDKTNTLIVLAPYFVPFYTVLWMGSYTTARVVFDLPPHPELFQGAIGATWAFHMAYTAAMVARGQPDLEYGGVFFSVVLIYLLNLLLICVLLIALSPVLDWSGFGNTLLWSAQETADGILRLVRAG